MPTLYQVWSMDFVVALKISRQVIVLAGIGESVQRGGAICCYENRWSNGMPRGKKVRQHARSPNYLIESFAYTNMVLLP